MGITTRIDNKTVGMDKKKLQVTSFHVFYFKFTSKRTLRRSSASKRILFANSVADCIVCRETLMIWAFCVLAILKTCLSCTLDKRLASKMKYTNSYNSGTGNSAS